MSNLSENKLKTYAAGAGLFVSVFLCLLKAGAAFFTGSLSVISSLIDSLTDMFSSGISLVAVHYSNLPFSDKHRYGYGKAESLSALLQAAFIVGSGSFILYDGINRFINPVEIRQTNTGIAVMIASLLITLALITFQKYVAKKTKSLAIEAESAHFTVDILTNFSIILSLLAVKYFGWWWIDIVTAAGISVYLIWNAVILAYEAISQITDKEVDEDIKKHLTEIISSTPEVKGFHDLRTRVSGARMFIELHLEIDGNKTLFAAHQISDDVEQKISNAYQNAFIIIHQDPFGIKENRLDDELKGHCEI